MDKKLNLLIFSGEYDKALAAFILANNAAELGAKVTMFFTFWGLLLMRDPDKMTLKDKTAYEKILEITVPKGLEGLPLSNMNIAGLGKKMLLGMMKDSKSPTLKEFVSNARDKGIRFCGCQLSIEVMGFKKEEFIPELEIVDAKEYLKDAMEADMQLFI
ncbi:MAG: DsrE/DsrF/DrsH-like family protein [Clostridiales bacterium]|nr:DsrE/DsrF/DrsH-like family protein [Clostridiales bacterium]HBM79489.1 sulfide reductase [Clostridiaceae bacterium]